MAVHHHGPAPAADAAPGVARIALVGSPNSGKTTLFNALTGLRAKTGNYPGVTVARYEGVARAEPADDTTLTWHMTYRTHHDGRLVAERTVSYPWHLLDEATLRTELEPAGLRAQPLGPPELGLYALTHPSAPIA